MVGVPPECWQHGNYHAIRALIDMKALGGLWPCKRIDAIEWFPLLRAHRDLARVAFDIAY